MGLVSVKKMYNRKVMNGFMCRSDMIRIKFYVYYFGCIVENWFKNVVRGYGSRSLKKINRKINC